MLHHLEIAGGITACHTLDLASARRVGSGSNTTALSGISSLAFILVPGTDKKLLWIWFGYGLIITLGTYSPESKLYHKFIDGEDVDIMLCGICDKPPVLAATIPPVVMVKGASCVVLRNQCVVTREQDVRETAVNRPFLEIELPLGWAWTVD